MTELEESLSVSLVAGMQMHDGKMHPSAKAIVCIAFKTGPAAQRFQHAYIELRRANTPTNGETDE